ncbi:hypothetical protein, partial [Streptomyces antarcticus]
LVARLSPLPVRELLDGLPLLDQRHRRWLAGRADFVAGLRARLTAGEFAETAARLLVVLADGTARPASARAEVYAQVARMLRDPDTVVRLLGSGATVMVLPQDLPLGSVSAFAPAPGTVDHRLAPTRGATAGNALVAALPEENLLGERSGVGRNLEQAEGYSSATHEMAHLLHHAALTDGDRSLIRRRYLQLRDQGPDAPWPDGPRRHADGTAGDNYAATNEWEFFAQLSNAHLGTNHGDDPHTLRPRNNGAAWVRANEPVLLPLLERLYGPDPDAVHPAAANPLASTDAENARYEAFRDFMTGVAEPPGPTAPEAVGPVGPPVGPVGHVGPVGPVVPDGPAGPVGHPFDEALLSALGSRDVTRLLDRDRPVPVADLAGTGLVLSAGQTAQAVLLGGSLTVGELGLTPLQHLRLLLGGPGGGEAVEAAWEAAARALGIGIAVTLPDGRTRAFGPVGAAGRVRLNFDGAAYVVTGGAS